jgi:hypothetical protein
MVTVEDSSTVPIIATFYGIMIRLNFGDHNPPHFHAEYQGYKAAFSIESGVLIAGEFPLNACKLVKSWASKNQAALYKNWKKARALEPLERISGEE